MLLERLVGFHLYRSLWHLVLESEQAAVDLGNVLLQAALTLAATLLLAQGYFVIEHPQSTQLYPLLVASR